MLYLPETTTMKYVRDRASTSEVQCVARAADRLELVVEMVEREDAVAMTCTVSAMRALRERDVAGRELLDAVTRLSMVLAPAVRVNVTARGESRRPDGHYLDLKDVERWLAPRWPIDEAMKPQPDPYLLAG